jgi:hypothetical protein
MSSEERHKLKKLMDTVPKGAVALSSWLNDNGYSPQLLRRYRTSGWLSAVGTGAMIRAGDRVGYEGAVYALQNQASMQVAPGARTALALLGKAHFLQMAQSSVILFGPTDTRLPKWFREADWGVRIDYHRTSFLPPDLGLVDVEAGGVPLKVSSAPRAVMECLHLASRGEDLVEARELMDGLNNLRPTILQTLLEACSSIKVKRLFLYVADLAGHDWVRHIDRSGIDLGSGTRSLVSEGTYIPEYKIMVPRELVSDAKPRL